MSYDYQYYLGYEELDSGIIKPYGPYTCDGKLKPILEKSCGFASNLHNRFISVPSGCYSNELRKEFEYEDWNGEKRIDVKYLYIEDFPSLDYIKKGYFLIDDVQAWEQGGDDDLFYHMITPQIYAEKMRNELTFGKNMPKKDIEGNEYTEPNASDYMYYAVPQYNSEEYEAWLISEFANGMCDYDFFNNNDVRLVILETEG